MASTLRLTFNASPDLVPDQILSVNINIGGTAIALSEIFKISRLNTGQVGISDTYNATSTASNFFSAWNQDYINTGSNNSLVASVSGTIVTITLNNDSWQFNTPTGTAISTSSVSYVVSNDSVVAEKKVSINQYSANSSDICGKADVQVLAQGGSGTYSVYVDRVITVSGSSSPITIPINRGVPKLLRITDSLGVTIGELQTINTRKLIPNDITVGVANYTSGATVTVSVAFISAEISVYTYSLDNSTFQTSNIFTGQSTATYTLYVKDGFGCVVSTTYIVDGATQVTNKVFDVSNINSFRFSKVDDEKKNQLNTLSFNELRLTKYPYIQKYLSTDTITTQFKTNGSYINCYTLNNQGNKNTLSTIKKTTNIGLQAKTTSTYFDLSNGRSGIYFGVVDSLNYLTDAVIEQLNYGSALPIWANTEGGLVTIEGLGQVAIDKISYSDTRNSFILEFNIAYTGSEVEKKISAEYNIQPYEIYEFDTVVSDSFTNKIDTIINNYKEKALIVEAEDCLRAGLEGIYPDSYSFVSDSFNVVIEVGSDASNIDHTYISECVKQVSDTEFLFDISYWDDENKGKFNYQTGIKNKLRMFGYQDDIGEQETEGYNGDKEFYVTDNVIYDVQRFTFLKLSTQIANKLRLVFAHKYILINGLYYKLSEAPEVSGDGNYNMKKFVVNLKQSGEQFLTTEQEIITDSPQSLGIGISLAEAQGKGILAWTKSY